VIGYASHTGTKRNLEALRLAEWRLMITPHTHGLATHDLPYALDNGAWSDFAAGRDFDDNGFRQLVDRLGRHADFVVAPDVVEGGLASLRLSVTWLAPLLTRTRLVLVPVQDGMEPADMDSSVVLPGHIGVFLGGSTAWKLANMRRWGEFCAGKGVYYHVGRVNSFRRIALAQYSGADSIDGSSASRYSVNLPKLTNGLRQWDMWPPPTSRERIIAWANSPSPDIDGRGAKLALGLPVSSR
jgi:hypothetical protein